MLIVAAISSIAENAGCKASRSFAVPFLRVFNLSKSSDVVPEPQALCTGFNVS